MSTIKANDSTSQATLTTGSAQGQWPRWDNGSVVWILEDSSHDRAIYVNAVTLAGFSVREFDNLYDFIEATQNADQMPDAVIADIRLGDGDFFMTVKDYAPLKIPTIVLSAAVESCHVAELEKKGMERFTLIEKPATPKVLAARVCSMVKKAFIDKMRSDTLCVDGKNGRIYNSTGSFSASIIDLKIMSAIEASENLSISRETVKKVGWPEVKNLATGVLNTHITRLNKKLKDINLRLTYDREAEFYYLSFAEGDSEEGDECPAELGADKAAG